MINKPLSEKRTPLTYCLYALAMLIPCAYLLMWYVIQGRSFLSAKPYFSDEIGYWRLMYSIDNCGFGFGINEGFVGLNAKIGNLGCHGIAPILAWGWYALLFTWRENSVFTANFIMLTVSIAALIFLCKPDKKKTIGIIALLLLYSPVVLYINTAMMEIPCSSAVILYSALYLRWRSKREKPVFFCAVIFGIYMAGLRICYAALLLPLLWESCGFSFSKKAVITVLALAVGTVCFYKITSLFVADYPWWFTLTLKNAPKEYRLQMILSHSLRNIKVYFASCLRVDAEAAFRWMYLASMLYFLYKSIAKGERRRLYLSFFVVYAAMLAANIALYDVYGWLDYRMLSPSLLFALLFTISDAEIGKGVKAAALSLEALALCVTLITVIPAGTFVHEERFTETQDNKAAFAEVFGEEIASVSTMCEDGVFDRVKDIPPQIGIKWMTDEGGIITSDTEFIMIGADDREVSSDYEFVGKPADKCYVYRKVN